VTTQVVAAEAAHAADQVPPALADAVSTSCASVSHNLNGQKLGRKGRYTRERILAATIELLDGPDDEPITMSRVASHASLGMASLYTYFNDLTELLIAVLDPVMATAETVYLKDIGEYWSDEELGGRCQQFLAGYFSFWDRHSRLMHLRNTISDAHDDRMLYQRIVATRPVISMIASQIDPKGAVPGTQAYAMATILMTGIERTVTVATDKRYARVFPDNDWQPAEFFLKPEARLMELAIRDTREKIARGETL